MLATTKQYQPNDIVTFKLTTGEEIVTKLLHEEDTTYTVTKPLALVPMQQGMALAPAVFTIKAEENVLLNKHAVMMHGLSDTNVAKDYREKTSGLLMPK
jgi:hypothetical protein